MGRPKKTIQDPTRTQQESRPALTPEGQEARMISLAVAQAEKQLMEGTAPSQIVTHYLKLATVKERLEVEKLREENKLLRAKTEAIETAKDSVELYQKAIAAMKIYQGVRDEN